MEVVIDYFSNDPLKAFYLLGGTGGIWFWVEKWRYRLRFELVALSETYDPIDSSCDVMLKISCRNLGNATTSLKNTIKVNGYFGSSEPKWMSESIQLKGRILPLSPHEVRDFSGISRLPVGYCFPLLKKYEVAVTVGINTTAYYLGGRNRCSAGRWYYSLLMFKLFNKKPTTETNAAIS